MKNDFHENLELVRMAQEGDEAACERLMILNSGLVGSVARRFMGRGTEYEDLVQIGNIGMLKAIRSFDLSRGVVFSTYATPLIIGEIRRFLRDDGMIKVGREQKRLGAQLMWEREKFIHENSREPVIDELAARCGCSREEAAEAFGSVSSVLSLSESPTGESDFKLESTLPSTQDTIERAIEHIALTEAIGKLPELWRRIIILRYFKDYSQQETADALGVTQVKISREEKKIFARLRGDMQ